MQTYQHPSSRHPLPRHDTFAGTQPPVPLPSVQLSRSYRTWCCKRLGPPYPSCAEGTHVKRKLPAPTALLFGKISSAMKRKSALALLLLRTPHLRAQQPPPSRSSAMATAHISHISAPSWTNIRIQHWMHSWRLWTDRPATFVTSRSAGPLPILLMAARSLATRHLSLDGLNAVLPTPTCWSLQTHVVLHPAEFSFWHDMSHVTESPEQSPLMRVLGFLTGSVVQVSPIHQEKPNQNSEDSCSSVETWSAQKVFCITICPSPRGYLHVEILKATLQDGWCVTRKFLFVFLGKSLLITILQRPFLPTITDCIAPFLAHLPAASLPLGSKVLAKSAGSGIDTWCFRVSWWKMRRHRCSQFRGHQPQSDWKVPELLYKPSWSCLWQTLAVKDEEKGKWNWNSSEFSSVLLELHILMTEQLKKESWKLACFSKASQTTGCPTCAKWHRIWCWRPVTIRKCIRVKAPGLNPKTFKNIQSK